MDNKTVLARNGLYAKIFLTKAVCENELTLRAIISIK